MDYLFGIALGIILALTIYVGIDAENAWTVSDGIQVEQYEDFTDSGVGCEMDCLDPAE